MVARRLSQSGIGVAAFLLLITRACLAHAVDCAEFTVDSREPSESNAAFATRIAAVAAEANSAECLETADRLYEGAYRTHPDALFVYRRILVRERMADFTYARELLGEFRDELLGHPEVDDLALLDARLREAAGEPSTTAPRRSVAATIGPIVLGVVGTTSLGMALYGVTAPGCSRSARDGSCLQGVLTSSGPTIAYTVVGIGAVVGAIVWWVAGSPTPSSPEGPTLTVSPQGFRFVF